MPEVVNSVGNVVMRHFKHYITERSHRWLKEDNSLEEDTDWPMNLVTISMEFLKKCCWIFNSIWKLHKWPLCIIWSYKNFNTIGIPRVRSCCIRHWRFSKVHIGIFHRIAIVPGLKFSSVEWNSVSQNLWQKETTSRSSPKFSEMSYPEVSSDLIFVPKFLEFSVE